MKAEVYPSPDGWRFRVKGDNGEIMAVGEAYVRRIDAESALRALFTGTPVEVTVRDHHTNITDHYTLSYAEAAKIVEEFQMPDPELPLWEAGEPPPEEEPEV